MTGFEQFFDALEHTDLSLWVRGESLLAFPLILTVHTIGMGFLAGTSWAVGLRILGLLPRVPVAALANFYPVVWMALTANFSSGVLLFMGYPYKAATNPVFYLKLTFIALGVFLALKIKNGVLIRADDFLSDSNFTRRAKQLAGASMLCWVSAITAGRLLAYTFTWLRVGIPGGF